jgi:hypothetical protein
MKVPVSVESAFIPMEAEDIPSLQKQRRKRNQYWMMLYNARQEYLKLTDQQGVAEFNMNTSAFFYYLKQNYGLQVETVDGKITGDYAVVNEQKYLIFLMKFGS